MDYFAKIVNGWKSLTIWKSILKICFNLLNGFWICIWNNWKSKMIGKWNLKRKYRRLNRTFAEQILTAKILTHSDSSSLENICIEYMRKNVKKCCILFAYRLSDQQKSLCFNKVKKSLSCIFGMYGNFLVACDTNSSFRKQQRYL